MTSFRRFIALMIGILIPSGLMLAGSETYKIDPGHSHVGFTVRHFFSKVPGKFNQYEGTITLDPKKLTTAAIEVTIDAASIDTGVEARDKDLRSESWFDVEKHTKITFVSTEVKPQGPSKAKVRGNLTIHGVTKPVELEAEVLGYSPDPWGGYRGSFEAKIRINRQDFGLTWNKVVEGGGLVVGNDVDIVLQVEAVRQAPEAAAPEGSPKKN